MHIQKKYLVNRTPVDTMSIFTDLSSYASFHPLIRKVELNKKAGETTYRIFEKPYSILPIKISYQAAVIAESGKVIYLISGLPGVHPTLTYLFDPRDTEQTEVTMKLYIEGNQLIAKLLGRKMLKAQDRLMSNIG